MKILPVVKYCLVVFALSACGTDSQPGSSSNSGSTPTSTNDQVAVTTTGSSPSVDQSSITLRITDAPVDNAARVVVTFLSVELKVDSPQYSRIFEFNEPKTIDLLTLQGTETEDLLNNVTIQPGQYNEIRLVVDDSNMSSFIELTDGTTHPLKIPSGATSGLKLNGEIIIPANRTGRFTIDFDVKKSLVRAGNSSNYLLKPVLRLVDDTAVGHIRGNVDPTALTDSSCSDSDVDTHNAVYVFTGAGVIPDDIDLSSDQDIDPITTASIRYDSNTDRYLFEAAFLEAGEYTIAFTCNANLEDIDSDNELLFFNIQNVTVQVNDNLFL